MAPPPVKDRTTANTQNCGEPTKVAGMETMPCDAGRVTRHLVYIPSLPVPLTLAAN